MFGDSPSDDHREVAGLVQLRLQPHHIHRLQREVSRAIQEDVPLRLSQNVCILSDRSINVNINVSKSKSVMKSMQKSDICLCDC